MGVGDFLKHAWNASEEGVAAGMKAASDAVVDSTDFALGVATRATIVAANTAAAVGRQVSTAYNLLRTVAPIGSAVLEDSILNPSAGGRLVSDLFNVGRVYDKIQTAFTDSQAGAVASECPCSGNQELVNAILSNNNLLSKAAARNLSANPNIQALRQATSGMEKALMAEDAYNDNSHSMETYFPGPPSPPLFKRLSRDDVANKFGQAIAEMMDSTDPNVHAALYEYLPESKPPHYTLALRGTDLSSRDTTVKDAITDVENNLGIQTPAYKYALSLGVVISSLAAADGATLDLTGHSMGGGFAQTISAATGLKATTFNSAAPASNFIDSADPAKLQQNITNYHVSGEIVTTVQGSLPGSPLPAGTQQQLPAPKLPMGTGALSGSIQLHSMDSVEKSMAAQNATNQEVVSKLVGGP